MNQELKLCERLRNPQIALQRTIKEDVSALYQSVKNQLQKILNTKQGQSLTCPDYGMPDFTEFKFNLPDAVKDMERAIQYTIEKYEPRIQNVQVKFMSKTDNLQLNFEIKAEIILKNGEYVATFNTVVNSSGSIKIDESK
jgi:type VI secretion system protein